MDFNLSEFWAKSELCFCGLYLYSGIFIFAPNLTYLCCLLDLIPIIGSIWFTCLNCSHFLLSDFSSVFAVNLLMECELFAEGLFGTNREFAILEGICDANGLVIYGLTVEFEC